ncbi:hypothetical protein [Vreelandella stevensii]|uniref:hypothetical protein n=1 Tax=Vreelandella stevensii TaxID=502821 RepID=UPI003749F8D5
MTKHRAQIGSYNGSGVLLCDFMIGDNRKEFHCSGFFSYTSRHLLDVTWALLEGTPNFTGMIIFTKLGSKHSAIISIPVTFLTDYTFNDSDSEVGFEATLSKAQLVDCLRVAEFPTSYEDPVILH